MLALVSSTGRAARCGLEAVGSIPQNTVYHANISRNKVSQKSVSQNDNIYRNNTS